MWSSYSIVMTFKNVFEITVNPQESPNLHFFSFPHKKIFTLQKEFRTQLHNTNTCIVEKLCLREFYKAALEMVQTWHPETQENICLASEFHCLCTQLISGQEIIRVWFLIFKIYIYIHTCICRGVFIYMQSLWYTLNATIIYFLIEKFK